MLEEGDWARVPASSPGVLNLWFMTSRGASIGFRGSVNQGVSPFDFLPGTLNVVRDDMHCNAKDHGYAQFQLLIQATRVFSSKFTYERNLLLWGPNHLILGQTTD